MRGQMLSRATSCGVWAALLGGFVCTSTQAEAAADSVVCTLDALPGSQSPASPLKSGRPQRSALLIQGVSGSRPMVALYGIQVMALDRVTQGDVIELDAPASRYAVRYDPTRKRISLGAKKGNRRPMPHEQGRWAAGNCEEI